MYSTFIHGHLSALKSLKLIAYFSLFFLVIAFFAVFLRVFLQVQLGGLGSFLNSLDHRISNGFPAAVNFGRF